MRRKRKAKKYHRTEWAYGSFERRFVFPENAKPDQLTAEYKDGVLKVHLPKSGETKPKPVEIAVS